MKNNIPAELRNASGIYEIRNFVNGKMYIGMSVNFNQRRAHHLSNLRRGSHSNRYLQCAYNKYGPGNFQFAVLLEIKPLDNETRIELISRMGSLEQKFIKQLNTDSKDRGYNLRSDNSSVECKTLVYNSLNKNNAVKAIGFTKKHDIVLVKSIKLAIARGASMAAIARYYSVSSATVYAIKQNKQWKYVTITAEEIKSFHIPLVMAKRKPGSSLGTKRKEFSIPVNSKLNEANLKEIAKLLRQGIPIKVISVKFGVNRETITRINLGRTWSGITGIMPGELGRYITPEVALSVKKMLLDGCSSTEIANALDITFPVVYGIAAGKTWSEVTGIQKSNPIHIKRTIESFLTQSKLDAHTVVEIKKKVAAGCSVAQLSKDYPLIKRDTIYKIASDKTWKHVQP